MKLVIRPPQSNDSPAYTEGSDESAPIVDALEALAARIKKLLPDIDVSIEEDDPDVETLKTDNACLRKAIEAVVRGAMNAERESCAQFIEAAKGTFDKGKLAASLRARK